MFGRQGVGRQARCMLCRPDGKPAPGAVGRIRRAHTRFLVGVGLWYGIAMLRPYRVLDLTDSRAELGPLMLAGLGAEVIKVEPPGGCSSRREPPFAPDAPPELASLRFHALNRGKRSVVVDLESASGRERFRDLVAGAGFLFE